MKANQLVTLVLRLMGIYCLIEVVSDLPVFTGVIFAGGIKGIDVPMAIGSLTTLVVIGVIGILLISFSPSLGQKLAPKDAAGEINLAVTFKELQTLAFAVAGIFIFADALPHLFTSLAELYHWLSPTDAYPYPPLRNSGLLQSAAGTLLKTILGIWLFFGAKGFANFWGSLRNFATPKPPQAG